MEIINRGDIILLFGEDGSKLFAKVEEGIISTHLGKIDISNLIGKEYGVFQKTHIGKTFFPIKPTIFDLIMGLLKRETQIVYPKDAAYIILKLGICNGKKILECGTGSGAMTAILSHFVGDDGKVISIEKNEKFYNLARENIEKFGLLHRVLFINQDIREGIKEGGFDAAFIDVREPWEYIDIVFEALLPGGRFGAIVPTTNQVQNLLKSMFYKDFIDIEVCEILLRRFKNIPERLRPEDRMVAHTGYLIFATKVKKPKDGCDN